MAKDYASHASFSTVFRVQVVINAKNGVKDGALVVILSYDLASRMVDNSLLWQGQVMMMGARMGVCGYARVPSRLV